MNPSRGPNVPPTIASGRVRRPRADFSGVEHLHRDAARLLEGGGGLHRGKARRVAREEEVPRLPVDGRLADLVREGVEDVHRREGHRDVDVRRELGADAAVRLRRRPAARQRLLVDQEDVPAPEAREVKRDAAADDAGADDGDVGPSAASAARPAPVWSVIAPPRRKMAGSWPVARSELYFTPRAAAVSARPA